MRNHMLITKEFYKMKKVSEGKISKSIKNVFISILAMLSVIPSSLAYRGNDYMDSSFVKSSEFEDEIGRLNTVDKAILIAYLNYKFLYSPRDNTGKKIEEPWRENIHVIEKILKSKFLSELDTNTLVNIYNSHERRRNSKEKYDLEPNPTNDGDFIELITYDNHINRFMSSLYDLIKFSKDNGIPLSESMNVFEVLKEIIRAEVVNLSKSSRGNFLEYKKFNRIDQLMYTVGEELEVRARSNSRTSFDDNYLYEAMKQFEKSEYFDTTDRNLWYYSSYGDTVLNGILRGEFTFNDEVTKDPQTGKYNKVSSKTPIDREVYYRNVEIIDSLIKNAEHKKSDVVGNNEKDITVNRWSSIIELVSYLKLNIGENPLFKEISKDPTPEDINKLFNYLKSKSEKNEEMVYTATSFTSTTLSKIKPFGLPAGSLNLKITIHPGTADYYKNRMEKNSKYSEKEVLIVPGQQFKIMKVEYNKYRDKNTEKPQLIVWVETVATT